MYLGINAFFHDASATIIDKDGHIIAAAEEERFTRNKRESRFPIEAIKYCLKEANVSINDLDGVGFSWDPRLFFFQRILWSNLLSVPSSLSAIKENVRRLKQIRSVPFLLKKHFNFDTEKAKVSYFRHHSCHAANAFYSSPFKTAAFLTMDGQGELESITWGICENEKVTKLGQSYFPNSIGKVYSGVSRFLGFFGSEKEGTVMALAAFGKPVYLSLFESIMSLTGNKKSLKINVDTNYFDFEKSADLVLFSKKFEEVFKISPRKSEDAIEQIHKDIASSLQKRTEEVILEFLDRLSHITKEKNVVLSGGVALNSVLNGKIETISSFKNVFIQPASSDAGLSLGAAYLLRAQSNPNSQTHAQMVTASLGPSFTNEEYEEALDGMNLKYYKSDNLIQEVAQGIADGKVVAWFQGKMEFGPRALGCRSLLGDARRHDMIDRLNKVKHRESFRPFAISILEEEAGRVLNAVTDSPFMLKVDFLRNEWLEKLPSAQHVDGSVRVQTVTNERDGIYYDLIKRFDEITGVLLVINTSLNIKGQPIVCGPVEAIETFLSSEIDLLVLGEYIVKK